MRSTAFLAFALSLTACILPSVVMADDFSDQEAIPKLALVVGNASYPVLGPVPKAHADASRVADLLASRGADVVVRTDLDSSTLFLEIRDLLRRAAAIPDKGRPVAFFYFSGHGFTQAGRQFLAGTDAGLAGEDPAIRSIAVDKVVDLVAEEGVLIAMLDACRSDFSFSPALSSQIEQFSRSAPQPGTKGPVGVDSGEKIRDYLLSYANQLGRAVLGYTKENDTSSPYSHGLSLYLGAGDPLRVELGLVRTYLANLRINHDAGTEDHLRREIYLDFSPEALQRMGTEWRDIQAHRDTPRVERFLARYGNGPFARAAERWLQSR